MLFNSIQYLLFLQFVILIYYIVPKKIRYIWLLLVSYYFYICWNPKYVFLIAASTSITFFSGLGIQFCREKFASYGLPARLIVAGSIFINLGLLFYFKYFEWMLTSIGEFFSLKLSSPLRIVLPVGISFYIFQSLSYTIDIYRGELKAEKNFFRYALFVSFFPQLVAGPIERSKNLLVQLRDVAALKVDFDKIRDGLCLILYGLFLKLVIADRCAILVDATFDNYIEYGFLELLLAVICFAIQILCDFNGYTIIAQGSALMLGIKLMDNFRQPYLALSIHDFWRRWHISLTSWFTDYLYIPLGGNRKGIIRKMVNVMIVFLISGLWHGASWNYVVWGGIHGVYQNIGIGIRILNDRLKISDGRMKFSTKAMRIFVTFLIVDIAWVFFRSPDCVSALKFFRQMFSGYQKVSLLALGLEWYDWLILVGAVMVMFCVDILHEKGVKIRKWLYNERIWFRWLIYLGAFWTVLMFGLYGVEYDASQFIYFQF